MRVLAPHDLLELCEHGSRLYPLDKGLLVLRAALPEVASESFPDWPLGKRNRALLELHALCFGSRLQAWAECSQCGEKLEFEADTHALLGHGATAPEGILEVNGHSFRLPTSRDLAQAAQEADPVQGAMRLLQTCCIGSPPAAWTEEDVNAVGEAFAVADPAAELRLALVCPVCGKTQEETLDPVTFVWSEVHTLAKRLLLDVHTLASVYGWNEQEILSLSDFRRSKYVEMVRA